MKVTDFLSLRSGLKGLATPRPVRKLISLCKDLLSEHGEVSGARMARDALISFQALRNGEREAFYDLLIAELSPDPAEVGKAADAYRNEPSAQNYARLQRATESPRQELFRRLNVAPGATGQLIEIRRSLLERLNERPQWAPIEADLAHLLFSWFNRGFLVLQRIDWRTPAIILEKLIQYEAVHEIRGWMDLRRRLESDRRCYAFFHPALPDEPIIFIEVALTRGMSAQIQMLIDPGSAVNDPATADSAIFYSITNCQDGLRGVPFGSFLIKRVVEDLGKEFPRIRHFATLSPVSGFRKWLAETVSAHPRHPRHASLAKFLASLDQPKFEANIAADLRRELCSLCAYYLLHAKRGKQPLDPVARFHLRNGARLERIHALADTSSSGLERTAGFMVNYLYDLSDIETNHEQYTGSFKITASREVRALASQSALLSQTQKDTEVAS